MRLRLLLLVVCAGMPAAACSLLDWSSLNPGGSDATNDGTVSDGALDAGDGGDGTTSSCFAPDGGIVEDMVMVTGGTFGMGCNADASNQLCAPDEWACSLDGSAGVHQVTVATFQIDRTEVTVVAYLAVCDGGTQTAGCVAPTCQGSPCEPVTCIDWPSADAYCGFLGKRLPTEAEWEYAARGTDGRIYPWGNDDSPDCARANYKACLDGGLTQVGTHPSGASPFGALDMAGNAREWVRDWYDPNYYCSSPKNAPVGPDSGTSKSVRGGDSTYDLGGGGSKPDLRTSSRDSFPSPLDGGGPTSNPRLGFRCAK